MFHFSTYHQNSVEHLSLPERMTELTAAIIALVIKSTLSLSMENE